MSGGGDGMGGGSVADSTHGIGTGVGVAEENCCEMVHREACGPSLVGGRMKGIE